MPLTYKDAGVDKNAGYEEVQRIKEMCKKTYSKEVLAGVGGFAGLFQPDLSDIKTPVFVTGTDGVGTKLMIAQQMDCHDSCGIDLVAMCANDVICQGAKPLFFLDYIATGKLDASKMEQIVKGICDGVNQCNCSLIGGETAEMPGMYDENEYDLAGFIVGVVDKEKIIDGKDLKEGDHIIGLEATGLHSNGFSLARKIVFEKMGFQVGTKIDELNKTVGEALLVPTRIYVREILSLLQKVSVKAIANITGGGIYENIPRALHDQFDAKITPTHMPVPEIFHLLQQWGEVETEEMYHTFNMGIGMVLVVSPEDVETTLAHFTDYKAVDLGTLVKGTGEVHVER